MSNKYVFQALFQTFKTTRVNFEELLGLQLFKNHNGNPFQSSSSLSIRATFSVYLQCFLLELSGNFLELFERLF